MAQEVKIPPSLKTRRKASDPPEQGDVVCIRWVDIFENVNGDPRKAKLARRTSYGLFWEESQDEDIPVLVTTTTEEEDGDDVEGQEGFVIYPKCCVLSIHVVKRARRVGGE